MSEELVFRAPLSQDPALESLHGSRLYKQHGWHLLARSISCVGQVGRAAVCADHGRRRSSGETLAWAHHFNSRARLEAPSPRTPPTKCAPPIMYDVKAACGILLILKTKFCSHVWRVCDFFWSIYGSVEGRNGVRVCKRGVLE